MEIKREDVEILCTFFNYHIGGERKYTLCKEINADDCGYRGYWVVDSGLNSIDGRFFNHNIRMMKCETPLDYVKSKDFDYGNFANIEVVDTFDVWQDIEIAKAKAQVMRETGLWKYDHELGVPQDGGAWAEDAGIFGWDLDS